MTPGPRTSGGRPRGHRRHPRRPRRRFPRREGRSTSTSPEHRSLSRHRCVAGGGSARARRQFADIGDTRRSTRAATLPGRTAGLRDVGDAHDGVECRAGAARPDRGQPRRRAAPGPVTRRRAGGTRWSGPGKAIDTERLFVVARQHPRRLPGHRPDRPRPIPTAVPWGGSFPALTVRDQVAPRSRSPTGSASGAGRGVVGGSAGRDAGAGVGGRASRAGRAAVPARDHGGGDRRSRSRCRPTADRRDPRRSGVLRRRLLRRGRHGPARRVSTWPGGSPTSAIGARPSSRERFGRPHRLRGPTAGSPSSPICEHHGAKLVSRFDANSYIVLSGGDEQPRRRPGPRRGGRRAGPRSQLVRSSPASDSDRLYPLHQQQELADGIPGGGIARGGEVRCTVTTASWSRPSRSASWPARCWADVAGASAAVERRRRAVT